MMEDYRYEYCRCKGLPVQDPQALASIDFPLSTLKSQGAPVAPTPNQAFIENLKEMTQSIHASELSKKDATKELKKSFPSVRRSDIENLITHCVTRNQVPADTYEKTRSK